MILKLDMNSTVPIYVQLRNQIVMGIGHGELKEGERLPTVRQLASDAGVNTMTVNKMYQRVIEETQPNYTTMQRAGIQRSDNEITKTLTMFTTQRFQNYGILADAVMDYNTQKARFEEGETEETKAELQRAGKQLSALAQGAGGRPNKELKRMAAQVQALYDAWRA